MMFHQDVNSKEPDTPLFRQAIRIAFQAFQLPKRVPLLHLNDVFKQDLPIWSSSPGLPWTQQGYETKDDIRCDPAAIQRVRKFWYVIKRNKTVQFPEFCTLVRSHLSEAGEAQMNSSLGYSATITFGEAVFAEPLIRAFQTHRTPITYEHETANGLTNMFHDFKGEHFLEITFSNFDETIPAWLKDFAFAILSYNLKCSAYQDYGVPDASQVNRMLTLIANYYIESSSSSRDSYFAPLINSIVNYILIIYSALSLNVAIGDIVVFGTEAVVGTNVRFTAYEIKSALEELDITVKVEKYVHSRNISNLSFLGSKIKESK